MININLDQCIGCSQCIKECFPGHLEMKDHRIITNDKRCMECGHCVAVCPVAAISMTQYDMTQVVEYEVAAFQVDSGNLMNFMKHRRSIRQFAQRKVEKETIAQIIEAGRYSPTGTNRQSLSYVVLEEDLPDITQMAINGLYQLAQQDSPASANYRSKWIEMYQQSLAGKDLLFYHAPVVIAVVEKNSNPSDIDGALAASRMELMANALGLGCCFNGFFVRAVRQVPEILKQMGLNSEERIITTLAIGYSNIKFERTAPRKEAEIQWR